MAQQRQYEAATVFNARSVDMRHLWEPSREYMGKPSEKPNYFGMWIVPKTQAHWSTEPIFGGVMAAFTKLLGGQLQAFAQNVNAVNWPIADGDMPSPAGKSSEFAKGHWLFSASTNNPPNIELAQAGGTLVKLPAKVGVKSGDHCMLGVTAAVKQNDPRGVKFYLNAVVFTHPGDEIVFANSVSGAELMRMAQQQGLQVAGFSGAPGGFGGAPGGGFGAAPGQNAAPGFTQPGNFAQPPGAPGFAPGGPAPGGGFGNPAINTVPGHSGPGFGGNVTYPSSANNMPNPSFPGPGGFGTPPNPFGPR